MDSQPLRRHSIVAQDGVINCTIKQLSPSIWNARLILQVLKIMPISSSNHGTSHNGVSVIARDALCMVQVCVWDSLNMTRANALNIGDNIEILFPDVKFRKSTTLGFPGTVDHELHIGAWEKSNSTQREGKASITATATGVDFEESLAPSTYSSITEVCIKECLNSVVTVGAVLSALGELKNGPSSTYRTHRLWDPNMASNGQEYVNLTLWGADTAYFEKAAVGDFVLAERVKVIQFHGSLQLATTHHTLIHINPPLRSANVLKAQFSDLKTLSLDQPSPPLVRSAVKNPRNFAFGSVATSKSKAPKPVKAAKPKFVSSALITDFFPPASVVEPRPASPEPQFELQRPNYLHAPTRLHDFVQDHVEPVLVPGRFSVNDSLQLCDGQLCHSIACLSSILPRSPRGLCIYNCSTCMRAGSSCECSLSLRSCAWSYDIRVSWKDYQSEIAVDLNSTQAAQLLGIEPSIFVDMENEIKYNAVYSLIGRTYRIVFGKARGITYAKEFFELPAEQ